MAEKQNINLGRRKFLKQAGALGGLAATQALLGCESIHAKSIAKSSPPAPATPLPPPDRIAIAASLDDPVAASRQGQWAVQQLRVALQASGVDVEICQQPDQVPDAALCIIASGPVAGFPPGLSPEDKNIFGDSVKPESVFLARFQYQSRQYLHAAGTDPRGLVYALTELADAVERSDDPLATLRETPITLESPANQVRSVMRLFVSELEDKPWFNDRDFWQNYLSMLVTQRFNRFNLALGLGYDAPRGLTDTYFYFAYPFLLSVPGYKVKVVGLSDAERDQNLEMLKFISDQCALLGLQFQLGIWTHAFQWENSPKANYVIDGLTPQTQAAYCRDALHQLLEACPGITGVTFRIHGESGVPEGSYDIWKTIFDGIVRTGRPLGIDMHAKGMDQKMIDVAQATGLAVTLSPKFWAEHMGLPYHQSSIRMEEMPKDRPDSGFMALSTGSRSFLRYGFGDLLTEDRKYSIVHRIWPGTQRLLLWGDPTFASDYSKAFGFCGSDGFEVFDPLSFKGRKGSGLPGGRDGYADAGIKPIGGDWRKFLYTYRLWGRLGFNPDSPPEIWRRQLQHDFGSDVGNMETSLGSASRILPLVTTAHDPSAANADYWPEMYLNMSLVDEANPGPYTDTPAPKIFGNVSSLDPQLFAGCNEFADARLKGIPLPKITPLEVAAQLDAWSGGAEDLSAATEPSNWYIRAAIDLQILRGLGRFFAAKMRAAVLLEIYAQTASEPAHQAALDSYRLARDAWSALARVASGAYAKDITFGPEPQLRGHWLDRLAAIEKDISAIESLPPPANNNATDPQTLAALLDEIANPPKPPAMPDIQYQPPKSIHRGDSLRIQIPVPKTPVSLRLCYRHLNQAEPYQYINMRQRYESIDATIDGSFTDSPFPLQYYFQWRTPDGVGIYPGFAENFRGQPYFVVRLAK